MSKPTTPTTERETRTNFPEAPRFREVAAWRRVWRGFWRRFWLAVQIGLWLLVYLVALTYATPPPEDIVTRLGPITSAYTFDYITWMVEALAGKLDAELFGVHPYLTEARRSEYVLGYLDLVRRIHDLESQINQTYADPTVPDAETATADLRAERDALRAEQRRQQPLAESIIEGQIASVLRDEGMAWLGQALPPVAMHFSELPNVLVVSPRDKIDTAYSQALVPGIPVDVKEQIEAGADAALDMSTLVVPIGGMALYPSMILETSWFYSAFEISAHEWTHHWFYFFPIGLNYMGPFPETRSINETATSVIGYDVGHRVVERFYPELVPYLPPLPWEVEPPPPPDPDAPAPAFDYGREMHATRTTVDRLLEEGKIEEAEAYMEARRQLFVQNGYVIRKLNQAYFAFYGGYQAAPGGVAGEDPIGPMVQEIHALAPTLKDFYWRMTDVTTYADLERALELSRAEWGAGR